MNAPFHNLERERWLDQIFTSHAARFGGVVRRNIADVERRIGRKTLELEVRRRGFHMIECAGQFVIVCTTGSMHIIC
ncbi:MAG: N-(5'-phosphoribosyl)anthranilate isomerase [Rhodobacteraceae bacterium]|nr:N-(5'-phosphoribosyl)anthranilate isomerase [Paracoccaceae bacterium]